MIQITHFLHKVMSTEFSLVHLRHNLRNVPCPTKCQHQLWAKYSLILVFCPFFLTDYYRVFIKIIFKKPGKLGNIMKWQAQKLYNRENNHDVRIHPKDIEDWKGWNSTLYHTFFRKLLYNSWHLIVFFKVVMENGYKRPFALCVYCSPG